MCAKHKNTHTLAHSFRMISHRGRRFFSKTMRAMLNLFGMLLKIFTRLSLAEHCTQFIERLRAGEAKPNTLLTPSQQ